MRFMGGTILVIHAGERMRRILTLSGLDKFIDIYQGLPRESISDLNADKNCRDGFFEIQL